MKKKLLSPGEIASFGFYKDKDEIVKKFLKTAEHWIDHKVYN